MKYSQALISFGAQCDRKLLHLQIRINRIENALGLLEKKLGIMLYLSRVSNKHAAYTLPKTFQRFWMKFDKKID